MTDLTFEQISAYFHLPINEASKELKICATILKKVCRANGITRWPHRKIRSLENMIQQLKLQLQTITSDVEAQKIQNDIADFEEKKEFLMRNPNISYKTIVPKSTLQTFSKSKSKTNPSSSSSSSSSSNNTSSSTQHVYHHHHHHYETKSSLKEQVLEALSKLSEVEPALPSTYTCKDILPPPHVDINTTSTYPSTLMNDNDNTSSSSPSSASPRKFNLPLKKEILKIEREKEEKLKGLASLCSSALHDDFEIQTATTAAVTPLPPVTSLPSGPTIQIISFDHQKNSPKKRKFDCIIDDGDDDHIQQSENNNDHHRTISSAMNRSSSSSSSHHHHDVNFEEFKSSFPTLKYQRIFESQPLYFISS